MTETTTVSLDAAWAEAEAALPKAGWVHEDGRFVVADGRWSVTVIHVQSGDGYFEPVEEGFKAFATVEPGFTARGDLANTPAAALLALAARLRAEGEGR